MFADLKKPASIDLEHLDFIVPCGSQLIVQPATAPEVTRSGLILPATTVAAQRATIGIVVAVGPGAADAAGVWRKPAVKVGDIIMFTSYTGFRWTMAGSKVEYITMDSIDVRQVLAETEKEAQGIEARLLEESKRGSR